MGELFRTLNEEDLDQVNGGTSAGGGGTRETTSYCPVCKKVTTFKLFSGGRAVCFSCNTQKEL